jgi:hypothetical protein
VRRDGGGGERRCDGETDSCGAVVHGEWWLLALAGREGKRAARAGDAVRVCVRGRCGRTFPAGEGSGAKINQEPKDQHYGDWAYGAEDLEGRRWCFGMRLRHA